MKWFAVLAFSIFLMGACSKPNEITPVDSNGNPVTSNGGKDLGFPLRIGNYWKYQRVDTTKINLYGKDDSYINISEEVMTIIGDTLIPSIDPSVKVYTLLINNLTNSAVDTNYLLSKKDKFAFFGHQIYLNPLAYVTGPGKDWKDVFKPDTSKEKDMLIGFSVPLYKSYFNYDSLSLNALFCDTNYVRTDTTVTWESTIHANSLFVNYLYKAYGSSAFQGGILNKINAFFKPGIGMVYMRKQPFIKGGSIYANAHMETWFTRRLLSYKVD